MAAGTIDQSEPLRAEAQLPWLVKKRDRSSPSKAGKINPLIHKSDSTDDKSKVQRFASSFQFFYLLSTFSTNDVNLVGQVSTPFELGNYPFSNVLKFDDDFV